LAEPGMSNKCHSTLHPRAHVLPSCQYDAMCCRAEATAAGSEPSAVRLCSLHLQLHKTWRAWCDCFDDPAASERTLSIWHMLRHSIKGGYARGQQPSRVCAMPRPPPGALRQRSPQARQLQLVARRTPRSQQAAAGRARSLSRPPARPRTSARRLDALRHSPIRPQSAARQLGCAQVLAPRLKVREQAAQERVAADRLRVAHQRAVAPRARHRHNHAAARQDAGMRAVPYAKVGLGICTLQRRCQASSASPQHILCNAPQLQDLSKVRQGTFKRQHHIRA